MIRPFSGFRTDSEKAELSFEKAPAGTKTYKECQRLSTVPVSSPWQPPLYFYLGGKTHVGEVERNSV